MTTQSFAVRGISQITQARIRLLALELGLNLGSVIEDALNKYLDEQGKSSEVKVGLRLIPGRKTRSPWPEDQIVVLEDELELANV